MCEEAVRYWVESTAGRREKSCRDPQVLEETTNTL
jgi:hypothetical protein